MIELVSGVNDAGRKLDRVLRKALPQYPLSLIHRLLRQKKVTINGKPAIHNTIVRDRDVIQINIKVNKQISVNQNFLKVNVNEITELPEIIWRGVGIIIFNKQPGIATHGTNSLETIVQLYLAGTLPPSLSFKPGPLHRLDKQTSGAIAFSQTLEGARWFSRLLHEKRLTKTYLAIVEGIVCKEELWEDKLIRDKQAQKTYTGNGENSKEAVTVVKPLVFNDNYTLIEVKISTGRTHQIRAQSAAHGHPLAGDRKYGGKKFPDGYSMPQSHGDDYCLHAWKIECKELAENVPLEFPKLVIAPLPENFTSRINLLFGKLKMPILIV
ncbi:MAG: RluA family pseudouridine synthase [Treponema sp.]|nr:RluA family pseudouridine synthase [Treponema sp.]